MHPKTIVYYHKDCKDGFASAYCVWKTFGDNATYIPMAYGDLPKEEVIKGSDVFILDFSFNTKTLIWMSNYAKYITLIDHHKTAIEELVAAVLPRNVFTHLDNNKAGCVLTWEKFYPNKPVPELIQAIGSRDIWDFSAPNTKFICAAIDTQKQDFDVWDNFDVIESIKIGENIVAYATMLIKSNLTRVVRIKIADRTVNAIDCHPMLISDTVGMLGENERIAAGFFYNSGGRTVTISLRSNKDNAQSLDVGAIAKKYGGGGHKHAAGFKVSVKEFHNMLFSGV